MAPQQQVVHGRAHNLATANHNGLLACNRYTCTQAIGSGVFQTQTWFSPNCHKAARFLTATCLFDELHAAVWGAGQEAVTQVPSSKLPRVDTRQPDQITKHTQNNFLNSLCS